MNPEDLDQDLFESFFSKEPLGEQLRDSEGMPIPGCYRNPPTPTEEES